MSTTKREIIDLAFDEIGVSEYNFDRPAEQTQVALSRFNRMMALWMARGIVFDPPFPFPGDETDPPVEPTPADPWPFSDSKIFSDGTAFYQPTIYVPTETNEDLDLPTNAPGWVDEAMVLNLAVRLAPAIGKQTMAETKGLARSAYGWVLGQHVKRYEMSMAGMPAGAAYKRPNYPFILRGEQTATPVYPTPLLNGADYLNATDE